MVRPDQRTFLTWDSDAVVGRPAEDTDLLSDWFLALCTVRWLWPVQRLPSYWRARWIVKRSRLLASPAAVLAERSVNGRLRALWELHTKGHEEVVATALGLGRLRFNPPAWLTWAAALESRGKLAAGLYCRLNDWAAIDFDPLIPGSGGWRSAWSDWEVAGFAHNLLVREQEVLVTPETNRTSGIVRALRALGEPHRAATFLDVWLEEPGPDICSNAKVLRPLRLAAFRE